MAAVYTTGTQSVSATAATDLRTALDAVIITHPSWSFVEQVTITGGTARVYKCIGSGANANSWGADFYVAMTVFTAAASVLNFQVFESWAANPTSQATRAVRSVGTASTAAPGSNSGYVVDNTGYPLDTSTSNVARLAVTLDATSTWQWGLHLSKSRIELTYNPSGGAGQAFLCGVYVPSSRAVATVASVFPLFAANVGNGSVIFGAPGVSFAGALLFSRALLTGGTMGASSSLFASSPNLAGALSTAGALSDGVESTVRGTGVVVCGAPPGASSSIAAMGFLRGSLPGAYVFYCSTSYPHALDLVVLTDATRLMPLGSASSALGLINVDSDN